MKTKAVIFDVDGVLVDTVPMHYTAWKTMFQEEGISFSYTEYQEKVNGLPRLTGITNIMPHASLSKREHCAQKKQLLVQKYLSQNKISPLRGVFSLLLKLQKINITLIAASSSKNVHQILKSAELTPYFFSVVSGNDFSHSKPHPEIFLTAAKNANVPPSACAIVEDAYLGILAGKNAKMKTISVFTSEDTKAHQNSHLALSSLLKQRLSLEFIQNN